ncbi:hypothetical protein MmiEs2_01410 [Methanimicrococcus stummii]|uniref:Methyltransferase type 11 domain-containing protein n=1 Tax=Methanimicrococcus stummii TaxID=3028294 RepID=A0AA96VKD4_9EURY|nr:class I SAM-dependent methyltransferase [Methanimicrococcus sp. Es2]WNY27962.1 hypothetical protein MmiEs2_01410 [Methanimicrococcus sp. Es2]
MTVSKKDVSAWDLEYAHLKWGGLAELSWIQNRLADDSFLLDAGSGEGRYLRNFCFKFPCVGIDISKTALARSMESISKSAGANKTFSNPNPDHIVSNISALPFANESFDGVLCLGVLQHLFLKDREKAAAEFYRVLKNGGRVFFEAFGEEDMRCSGAPAVLNETNETEPRTFERQNGIIYHYFEESEIRDLFEKIGFKTIDLQSLKKEKRYNGENYIRHHYRAVFEK